MRVAVVGAGLGGLAAAAHLAGRGHDVTVLERNDVPGGRAAQIDVEGFRLDTGPTVLTMPHLLEATFAAAGRDMRRYVQIDRVDPMYRVGFADGSALSVRHGRDAMTAEIRRFANAREAGAFGEFCEWLTELHDLEMPHFVDANYDSALDLLRRARAVIDLVRQGGFARLDDKVASFFEDERLRRAFSFQSMYAGVAPHEALALFSIVTYMDTVSGVYAARGGMHQVAAGLARALDDVGVQFRFDSPVTRILRTGEGVVTGVEIGADERFVADAVVCNADLPIAYRTLLGGVDAPRVARRGRYSPSCLLWVAGVRGLPAAGIAHHNVHIGHAWDDAFRDVMRRGIPMRDPSTLVSVPTVTDPSLAPAGCSVIYALEPVPNLGGRVDWADEAGRLAQSLRDRVKGFGYPTDVVVERVIDPLDWEAMGMERGTPFSLAHTLLQSGPFRPRNVDQRVPGLVFTGSSTTPGVGVPMVLLSGKLAAQRVERYARETSILRW